jgi:predicted O-methyltransferase YrrM
MPDLLPESTWTSPRPDCPHPERWHAVDVLATEHEVSELVGALVGALRPDLVVETGTHHGWTSAAIGRSLSEAGVGRLVTLEVDETCIPTALDRCAGLPVDIVVQASLDYLPDGPIDVLWLDSLTCLRVPEFRHFLPWLHDRSVVGFHDTGPHHVPPLRPDLDRLVAEGMIDPPLYLPTPRGVGFTRPTTAALNEAVH